MQNQFTQNANYAISAAVRTAASMKQEFVGTEHILIGLLKEKKGVAYQILTENGVELDLVLKLADQLIISEGGVVTKSKGKFTPRAKRVMDMAVKEGEFYGQALAGTEHILLALIKEREAVAVRFLTTLGVNVQKIFVDTLVVLGVDSNKAKSEYSMFHSGKSKTKSKTPILDRYTRNLTQSAKEQRLDPVVGREGEIQRLIQILSRRNKNNPCLLGEPGVGKTAVVEGLAQYIADGVAPASVQDKVVLTLDLSGMVAGTKYRGEFEERIKKLLEELQGNGNVLLFIDEIHTIVGAGNAEGAMDASNILKPALSRGEIQVIGATTKEEYRKYIEKDAALERRFQPVEVEEPSEQQTLQILKGLRPYYEKYHRVILEDEALEAAVQLSARYINDRFMPDKAIDVMDEAAARKRIGGLDENTAISVLKQELSLLAEEKEKAILAGELKEASRLKLEQEKKQKSLNRVLLKKQKDINTGDALTIKPEDIAEVVSVITKIPVNRLAQEEKDQLLHLEEELHKRVIGQDEAVRSVAHAVKRGRVGMKEPNHPIGTFLFLGPTGVGKTELCKALAQTVFGNEKNIIRVDMSEYMESYSVSKMIGSPPGYVGYEEGGQLSEKVRRHPYSVVLFDEIEKAHRDVFNILLQVLDEGHITDSQGRKISFKNTIIIMTSNCGAKSIVEPKQLGFATKEDDKAEHEKMKQAVMDEVKRLFKPEFINRIDETIVFHMLSKDNLKSIVQLMVSNLAERTREQLDISIRCDYRAVDYLLDKGTDKIYGARPLRRAIQTELEDAMADAILKEEIKQGDSVVVTTKKKKLFFKVQG